MSILHNKSCYVPTARVCKQGETFSQELLQQEYWRTTWTLEDTECDDQSNQQDPHECEQAYPIGPSKEFKYQKILI